MLEILSGLFNTNFFNKEYCFELSRKVVFLSNLEPFFSIFKSCCIFLIDYFSDVVIINFCETDDKLRYLNQDINESVMTFKE